MGVTVGSPPARGGHTGPSQKEGGSEQGEVNTEQISPSSFPEAPTAPGQWPCQGFNHLHNWPWHSLTSALFLHPEPTQGTDLPR